MPVYSASEWSNIVFNGGGSGKNSSGGGGSINNRSDSATAKVVAGLKGENGSLSPREQQSAKAAAKAEQESEKTAETKPKSNKLWESIKTSVRKAEADPYSGWATDGLTAKNMNMPKKYDDGTILAQLVRDRANGVKYGAAPTAAANGGTEAEEADRAKRLGELQERYYTQEREYKNAVKSAERWKNGFAVNSEAQSAAEKRVKDAQRELAFTRQEMQDIGGRAQSAPTAWERVKNTVSGAAKEAAGSTVSAIGTPIAHDAARYDFLVEEEKTQAQLDYDRAKADYDDAVSEYGEDSADARFAANILAEAERKLNEEVVLTGGGSSDRATADKLLSTADSLSEAGAADIAEAKRGASEAVQIAVDIGSQALFLGGDALLNVLVPGSGLAYMGVRAFGSGAQEARAAGADENEQMLYGLASSALEMVTEKIFDGVAMVYGKGAADDLVENVIGELAKTAKGRTALRALAGAAGEGTEEIISSLLQPFLQQIYDENAAENAYANGNASETIKGALYDGFIGAALALIGQGASIATGQDAQKNAALREREAIRAAQDSSGTDTADGAELTKTAKKAPTGNVLYDAMQKADGAELVKAPKEPTGETLEKTSTDTTAPKTTATEAATAAQNTGDINTPPAEGKPKAQAPVEPQKSTENTAGENVPAENGNGGTGVETARTQSSFKDNNLTKEERGIPGYTEEEQVHTVLKDKELKSRAEARVDADADGVLKELAGKPVKDWDADDIEASNVLIRRNMDEARALKKAGKTAEAAEVYKKLAPLVQTREAKGTKTGKELRLFGLSLENSVAKLSNKLFGDNQTEKAKKMSDGEKVKIVTEAERLTDKFNSTEIGDADGLIEIIKETAKLRNNVSHKSKEIGTAVEKYMRQAAKTEDGRTWLKAVAESNIRNMSLDYDDVSFRKGMRAIRYNMMLSGMHTFFSNVGGNTVFGSLMEPLANNASIPVDRLLSAVTGKKTVGADAGMLSPKWYKGFIDGAKRGIVESYLDAFTTEEGKYDSQQQRTYKMTGNVWEKFWSNSENISAYRMYATDQAAKGAAMGTLKPFFEKQVKRGNMTVEEMNELLAYEAKYRTFQYDSKLTKGGLKAREGADEILGLGTSVVPFARIAANVTSASLDYNSAFSFMNGLFEIGKMAKAQKSGKALEATMAQHKAAKAFGRGITAAGMTVGFMALKGLGVLKDYRDDDYDAEKQSGAEGRKGIQINYSALGRVIAAAKNGEDWKAAAVEREGDNFGGFEFLPPLNGLAYMGSMMYDAYTDEEVNGLLGYAGAYTGATVQSTKNAFLDFPAVSTISNFISGVKSNKAAFTPENATEADRNEATAKAVGATAAETGVDILLSNVIPAKVRGIAKGIDSVERNTNSTDWKEKVKYKVMSQIPKWREQVPAKMDAYGNEIKNEGGIRNFINKNLSPEPVVSHTQTEVSKKVEEVYKATGDAAVNPDFYPPKKLTFTVGKEKTEYKLNDEQQRQYQYIRGQTMQMYVQEALDKGKFDGLSDEEQAELIKDIKNLSNDIAKQEFAKDAKLLYETKYKLESSLQDPVAYLTADVKIRSDYEAKGEAKPSQGRELFENYLYYGIKGKDADALAEKNLGKKNLGAYTVLRDNNKRPQDIMEMLDAWDIVKSDGKIQDKPDGNYNQASVYKGLSGLNIPDSDKSKIWNYLLDNPKTQYSDYRAK